MSILCTALNLFVICIFIRIILSWFPIRPGSAMATVTDVLLAITEPVIGPIRRVIPPIGIGGMGFDLSPLIVLFGIEIIRGAVLHC